MIIKQKSCAGQEPIAYTKKEIDTLMISFLILSVLHTFTFMVTLTIALAHSKISAVLLIIIACGLVLYLINENAILPVTRMIIRHHGGGSKLSPAKKRWSKRVRSWYDQLSIFTMLAIQAIANVLGVAIFVASYLCRELMVARQVVAVISAFYTGASAYFMLVVLCAISQRDSSKSDLVILTEDE